MGKKVLLIFSKLEEYKDYHYVPLSLLSIAAPLEHYKIDYIIFDERVDEFKKLYEMLKEVSFVAITLFTGYQTHRGYEILKIVKAFNKEITTIVGGPHVSSLPRQTLESDLVDYVVIGYGEEPFYLLISQLMKNDRLNNRKMEGIGFKELNGEVIINPSLRRFNSNFWFELPYNKIDIAKYINPTTKRVLYVTSYGCPGMCTFCATPEQRKWVPKPIEIIKKDLDTLYKSYPFEELNIADATFFTQKQRVFELLRYLKRYKGLRWIADARADQILNFSQDELMYIKNITGKLIRLTIGLESGSRMIAEVIMRKGKDYLEKYKECLRRLYKISIPVTSGLIFGTPGETVKDLENTIEFLREVRKIHPHLTLSTTFFRPLPGTELYLSLKTDGFKFPESLEGWANYSTFSHYKYNEWMDIPWLNKKGKTDYKKLYEIFMDENKDILV